MACGVARSASTVQEPQAHHVHALEDEAAVKVPVPNVRRAIIVKACWAGPQPPCPQAFSCLHSLLISSAPRPQALT